MLVRDLRRRRVINATTRAAAIAGVLAAAALATACRRAAKEAHVDVRWTLSPPAPAIGPATLAVTLDDAAGKPVAGAKVRLEGHMTHAGMAPVFADAVEARDTPGLYAIAFTFTMEGDWILLVSVTLPDGARTGRRIDVRSVRASD